MSAAGNEATMMRERRARTFMLLVGMAVVLEACFVGSLCIGRYQVAPVQVVQTLVGALTGTLDVDPSIATVVLNVRLPRALLAILMGSGLAASGAAYQSVFSNPLVSSDILGVLAGASFGAALAILMSGSALAIQGSALEFGLLAVGMVIMLGRVQRKTQLYILVLAGVVASSLFAAFVSLTKYVADPYSKLPAITTWLMGSLSSSSVEDVLVAALVIVPCCGLLFALRWKLNLLSLDEEEAQSLGVNVSRLRIVVIVLTTFVTATTVSLCGIVGWIGLVIPHVCRMLVGTDHRSLVPATLLLGGSYLLVIDCIARAAMATAIPLSILTAIIGAPFFAWMLRKTGGTS